MAEQKQMRLSQAARKLNVSTVTITDYLAEKGDVVDSNPNTKLTFEQLETLAAHFKNSELLGDDSKAESSAPSPAAEKSAGDGEILYFRDSPKPQTTVSETPKEVSQEPEKIVFDNKLQGTTVVGKIDLDKKPSPPKLKEVVVETPPPTPKVEVTPPAPTPPPVVEEQPKVEPTKEVVVEAPKPIVEEPKVIVEPPKVVEQPQEEKPTEAPKPEKVVEQPVAELAAKSKGELKEEPKTDKKPKDKPTEAVKPKKVEVVAEEEIELIKAKGDKLQGLKVLGKIELPNKDDNSRKKRKRKRVVKQVEKPRDGAAIGTPVPTKSATPAPTNDKKISKPDDKRGGKRGNRKDSVSESDVKDSIKQTMAKMQGSNKSTDFGAKYRREKRRTRAEQQEEQDLQDQEENSILRVTEFISAAELASLMDVTVNEVIANCMQMGMFVSINQRLDAEAIQLIALEFDFDVEFISAEEEVMSDNLDIQDAPEDLLERAPIVTIMGHVDHGKTSLLDYIRRAKVASGEAGGITQHVGAYSVTLTEGENKGKKITFLDTPGHEAFTAMRARGAKVTDVVIIVVAADDSVMPQTKEAINHAQNAGVPIIIAINKIDKPGANPEKIRQDLSQLNILVESWGGKYQDQEVSAKQGTGIDELLDKIILESEVLELKANPNRTADGTVVEASLDKGRGYVSDVLVQSGTLKVGDVILAGQYYGRVRAMIDDLGKRIEVAGPATPVQILGLPGAPQAGDKFNVMPSEREAREIANKREQIIREQSIRAKKHITLDEIGRRKAIGSFQELNVIVKGDVDGSVEALSDSLLKLSTDEIQVRIIHKGVGPISESDVLLASAADAIVIGFQVRPSLNARKLAENEEIEIRLYSIIYDAINELKDALEGMLAPKEEEVIVGNVEVREVFKISKIGTVAGCYVLDGYIKRSSKVRIIRDGIVNHEGEISELKRFKDNVSEVKAGYECGLSIKGFNNIEIGDIVEVFEIREIKRKL